MKISTKGRYALRIMIDLAEHDNGEYIRLKDIARRQGVTLKYMEQIMPLLTKAGYVKSYRGNNGGYIRLERSFVLRKGAWPRLDALRTSRIDVNSVTIAGRWRSGKDCGRSLMNMQTV